jgi:glyoxylase-like metal-dependent hydrolase (beta-lactamase superfamily II)
MATRLREGIRWIDATGVNVYLLEHEDTVTLIDTGTPFDTGRIRIAIEEAGYSPAELDRILITHYDIDHVGSAGKLLTDTPVYVGRDDVGYLTGDERPPWRSIKGLTQRLAAPFIPNIETDQIIAVEDGDTIGGFKAFHAPGHTPGHTAYLHEELEVAFLGDLVIEREGSLRPTPWFLCDDATELRASVRALADRASGFEVAAMGHGVPFSSGGDELLSELAETI